MPKAEPPKVDVTKVRWVKSVNAHKIGDIEMVSTARVKNLTEAGFISLTLSPPPKPKVERAVAPPKLSEAADAPPETNERAVTPSQSKPEPKTMGQKGSK